MLFTAKRELRPALIPQMTTSPFSGWRDAGSRTLQLVTRVAAGAVKVGIAGWNLLLESRILRTPECLIVGSYQRNK